MNAPICPYCGAESIYTDSSEVYSCSYGMIYLCRPCQAWVGVHKGTDNALGRLANAELRQWKQEAHKWFDPLWQRKISRDGVGKFTARNQAYKWLSKTLEIPLTVCHIGMMDVEDCKRVVEVCKPWNK
jgi:hypothetical protein